MKKIICLFVFLAAVLSAQTFPAAVPTTASLSDPYTATPATLSGNITASALIIDVTSTAGIKYGDVIRIDDEYMQVCATYTTGNRIRICPSGRGFDGTTAATHSTGASILIHHQQEQFNRLAKEVVAIASTLGPNLDKVGRVVKVTIPNTALVAADLTQAVPITTLPANAVVTGVRIKHSEAFAATDMTSLKVSVGVEGAATSYTSAFDVTQAVSATALSDTALFKGVSAASHAVIATFTAEGANLGDDDETALTAGSVDIYVHYFVLP